MPANIASNTAVLSAVDAKMNELNAALGRLDDLTERRVALTESLAARKKQETEHLRNDAANEDDAVQSLITVRAKTDVQSARLASLDDQIREQKATTVALGNTVGSVVHTLFMQLVTNRKNRATAIFDSNFEMPWAAHFPKTEFINNAKLCREIANLSPHFNDYSKPTDVRIGQLRSFSKDYATLRDALVAEPDLALAPVGAQTPSAPQLTVVGAAA